MSENKISDDFIKYDKDQELLKDLKIAYASAMWSWSRIDSDLFSVYIAAIDGFKARFIPTQEAYFSVISAQSRLDITHKAAQASWKGGRLLHLWLPLHKICRSELGARGRIAHLIGTVLTPEKPHQKRIAIIEEHFWHPNKKLKYNEAKSVGYTADQLFEMSNKWDKLDIEGTGVDFFFLCIAISH